MKSLRNPSRKRIEAAAGVLLTSLAVLSLLGSFSRLGRAQDGSVDEAAFRRVSGRLLCQCGCGYMVLSCNHLDCPSATYIRKTIRTALAEGKTEEAAFQVIVDQYGPKILPEPPREGFAWMAWIMPFAGLLLGGGMVSLVLWKWMKVNSDEEHPEASVKPAAIWDAPPPEVPPAVVEKYRAQIDRQLENE
jgi:cytochrome c-type biogenesis protein CcmH/NrfF